MKIKLYSFLITLLVFISSCSNDDEQFSTIIPSEIHFVHEDGTEILENECINPNERYAVSINTTTKGSGSYRTTKVFYTVNGLLHNVTFNQSGNQIIPVTLVKGNNIVQLTETGVSNSVFYNTQGDFELVE